MAPTAAETTAFFGFGVLAGATGFAALAGATGFAALAGLAIFVDLTAALATFTAFFAAGLDTLTGLALLAAVLPVLGALRFTADFAGVDLAVEALGFAALLRAAAFFAGAFRGLVLFEWAGLHQTAGHVAFR